MGIPFIKRKTFIPVLILDMRIYPFHLLFIFIPYIYLNTTIYKEIFMARKHTHPESEFVRKLKKFFLSAFVVITFLAYFLHERGANAVAASPVNTSATTNSVNTASNAGPANPVANPAGPLPASQSAGYKNGTFTGPEANAYYGLVQVQVVIQNGKIANVKFLDYPHDRRTSQMINSQAMPWLTQEAIQAQSANINIISGATLTSEAFANSLQAALNSAAN
jgi:uncharacterized protein with FMN-binding domain